MRSLTMITLIGTEGPPSVEPPRTFEGPDAWDQAERLMAPAASTTAGAQP